MGAVISAVNIYLFEFKVINGASEGSAMRQLRERNYEDKYRQYGRIIHLVTVEFSKETRNVASFRAEKAKRFGRRVPCTRLGGTGADRTKLTRGMVK